MTVHAALSRVSSPQACTHPHVRGPESTSLLVAVVQNLTSGLRTPDIVMMACTMLNETMACIVIHDQYRLQGMFTVLRSIFLHH